MNNRIPVASAVGLPSPSVEAPGIPRRDVNVPMSSRGNMHPTWIENGADVLWTTGLSDCVAVATWDKTTGKRSLTHPNAGDVTEAWASELVRGLTQDTIVIIANGTGQSSSAYFHEHGDFANIKAKIIAALGTKPKPKFWMYFTPQPKTVARGLMMHSFVMYANGVFGRIGPTDVAVPHNDIIVE